MAKQDQAPRGRRAVLAGASGLVGGHILSGLLSDRTWGSVTALVRRTLPVTHSKLTQRVFDFDGLASAGESASDPDFPRGADVFCALGTTIAKAGSQEAFRRVDLGAVAALARCAAAAEARQFLLVSSVGANPRSRVFYSRVKGEAEEAVKRTGLATVHVFRPSLLLGERTERRVAERFGIVAAGVLSFAFVGPLRHYRPVEAREVARAMLRAARMPRPGVNVYEPEGIEAILQAG